MLRDTLICAGVEIGDPYDRVRRYCGLPWSGGAPEVWAYHFYDAVPGPPDGSPDRIDPVDVVTCAALHSGLSKDDLAFFGSEAVRDVEVGILAELPIGLPLAEAPPDVRRRVKDVAEIGDSGVGLSLLSKVLHRKRPELVPIFDKRIVDVYRLKTGLRGVAAWPALVDALCDDLADGRNHAALDAIQVELHPEMEGRVPSHLRLADIAIWMGGEAGSKPTQVAADDRAGSGTDRVGGRHAR